VHPAGDGEAPVEGQGEPVDGVVDQRREVNLGEVGREADEPAAARLVPRGDRALEQHGARAATGGCSGGRRTGRSTADDDDVIALTGRSLTERLCHRVTERLCHRVTERLTTPARDRRCSGVKEELSVRASSRRARMRAAGSSHCSAVHSGGRSHTGTSRPSARNAPA